jgi:hypothetical protein
MHIVAEDLDFLDETQLHDVVVEFRVHDLAQGVVDHLFGDRGAHAILSHQV